MRSEDAVHVGLKHDLALVTSVGEGDICGPPCYSNVTVWKLGSSRNDKIGGQIHTLYHCLGVIRAGNRRLQCSRLPLAYQFYFILNPFRFFFSSAFVS